MKAVTFIPSILLSAVLFSSVSHAQNMCSQIFADFEQAGLLQRKPLTTDELADKKRVRVIKIGNENDVARFEKDAAALYTYENANTSPAYIVDDIYASNKTYRLGPNQYLLMTSLKLSSAKELQKRDSNIQILSSSEKAESKASRKFSAADRLALETIPVRDVLNIAIYFKTENLPEPVNFEKGSLQKAIQRVVPDLKFSEVLVTLQSEFAVIKTKVTRSELEKLNSIKSVSSMVLEKHEGFDQVQKSVYAAKDIQQKQKKEAKSAEKTAQATNEPLKKSSLPAELPKNYKIADIEQALPPSVREGKQRLNVTFTGSQKQVEEFRQQYLSLALKDGKAKASSVYSDMTTQGGTFVLGDGKIFVTFPLSLNSAKALEKINSNMSVYLAPKTGSADPRTEFKKIVSRQADILIRASGEARFSVRILLKEQKISLNTHRNKIDAKVANEFSKVLPGVKLEKMEGIANSNTLSMTPVAILREATVEQIKALGQKEEIQSLDIGNKDWDQALYNEIVSTEKVVKSGK